MISPNFPVVLLVYGATFRRRTKRAKISSLPDFILFHILDFKFYAQVHLEGSWWVNIGEYIYGLLFLISKLETWNQKHGNCCCCGDTWTHFKGQLSSSFTFDTRSHETRSLPSACTNLHRPAPLESAALELLWWTAIALLSGLSHLNARCKTAKDTIALNFEYSA